MATDCRSILATWRKHFSQVLNVHGVNDVKLKEIHTEEPLVPETRDLEFEMTVPSNAKVKRDWSYTYISPYTLMSPKRELYLLFFITY